MNTVKITINGELFEETVPVRMLLVDFIREKCALTGTHVGCTYEGVCGACTIQLDGEAVKSCLMLAVQADGHRITTVEGLAQGKELPLLQPQIDDLPERQTVEVLRRVIRAILVLAFLVDAHEVGVAELARQPHLLGEALPLVGRLAKLGVDDLERDLDIDLFVVRAEDEPERADADDVLDQVAVGDQIARLVRSAFNRARRGSAPRERGRRLTHTTAGELLPAIGAALTGVSDVTATAVAKQTKRPRSVNSESNSGFYSENGPDFNCLPG